MSDAGRYSLVAWPPEELDSWMRQLQKRLGIRGFGPPHLNLRAPFETTLSSAQLIELFREALGDVTTFEMRFVDCRRFPHVFFLEFELTPKIKALHFKLLEHIQPTDQGPYDGEAYRPHLTLGLCVLPHAADQLWEELRDLVPPLLSFEVNVLSLTLEVRGEVQELHTFPLHSAEDV